MSLILTMKYEKVKENRSNIYMIFGKILIIYGDLNYSFIYNMLNF